MQEEQLNNQEQLDTISATPDSNSEVAFTILTGDPGTRLTKVYSIGDDGEIAADSTPLMLKATARIERITYLRQVESVIEGLDTNQCLATGIFDAPECEVVPNGDLTTSKIAAGVRARTLDHMKQPSPGLVMLDYDGGPSMPEQLRCSTPAEVMDKLARVSPLFQGIAYSGAASSSSGIFNTQTGRALDKTGFHCYIIVPDADLRVLRDWLKAKCWAAGMGYIDFGRNGVMLERCLVDLSVLSPERLIYEARPVLGKGVSRARQPWTHVAGTTLSGDFTLSMAETEAYQQSVAAAKADPAVQENSRRIHSEYYGLKCKELAKIKSIPLEEAMRLYPKPQHPVGDATNVDLYAEDTLYIPGEAITVEQLLGQGEQYHRTAMPDPIEGPGYGSSTAMFFYNEGMTPVINSFAHGIETRYFLYLTSRRDEEFSVIEVETDSTPDLDPHNLVKYSLRGMGEQLQAEMLEHHMVLDPIAIGGQWTVIFAPPNMGKTLIVLKLLITSIQNGDIDPERVFFINADDTHTGLTTKLRLAEQHGIHMLAPGYRDFHASDFMAEVRKLCKSGRAKDTIIVLDTLKKFVDAMDKRQASDFGCCVRESIAQGATVICLSHTNKNRSHDGKLVHAGTSDVLDDCDCAYLMDTIADDNGIRTVEFENIKSRGNVAKRAAFQYSSAENVDYLDLLASVKPVDNAQASTLRDAATQQDDSDAPVIDAIIAAIEDGVTAKMKIVDAVATATGVSQRHAKRVLQKHCGGDPNMHHWNYSIGAKGVHSFEILPPPDPDDEPDIEEL